MVLRQNKVELDRAYGSQKEVNVGPAGSSVTTARGYPTPLFFVSVASKGFSVCVSSLESTLAGWFISVAAKGLTGATCLQKSNWAGPDDFGGVRRTARREAIDGMARGNRAQATKGLYHNGTYCQVIIISGLSAVS